MRARRYPVSRSLSGLRFQIAEIACDEPQAAAIDLVGELHGVEEDGSPKELESGSIKSMKSSAKHEKRFKSRHLMSVAAVVMDGQRSKDRARSMRMVNQVTPSGTLKAKASMAVATAAFANRTQAPSAPSKPSVAGLVSGASSSMARNAFGTVPHASCTNGVSASSASLPSGSRVSEFSDVVPVGSAMSSASLSELAADTDGNQ